MALVNLKDVLTSASNQKYAIGSFNVINMESLHAILEAAVEKKSPVILSIAEVHFKYLDLEAMADIVRYAAKKAPIPVVLHLDHGINYETIVRAIRCGFTSVMFDGSTLDYEDNLRITAEVARMAHSIGVSVEAELGHVGGEEGGPGGEDVDRSLFTDPLQAKDFVKRTEIDALAVAIGSAHGVYKAKPKLDFERLVSIKKAVGIPLVLHGGSGIPDEDFKKSIELGISKINVFTEMAITATSELESTLCKLQENLAFPDLMLKARSAIGNTVKGKIEVFGSEGICDCTNEYCRLCGACVLSSPLIKKESADIRRSNINGTISEVAGKNGEYSPEDISRIVRKVVERIKES